MSKLQEQITSVLANLDRCRDRVIDQSMWKNPAQLGEVLTEVGTYVTYLGEIHATITRRYYERKSVVRTEEYDKMKELQADGVKATVAATDVVVDERMRELKSNKEYMEITFKTWSSFCTILQSRMREANEEARSNR